MTWDRKFAPQADRVFRSEGARLIITPLIQVGGCAPDHHSTHGAEGERPRRTLDRQLPSGVPGPDADSQPAAPGGSAS